MTYLWLALAVIFEVGWAISMKLSDGLARLGYTIATIVMYLLSVVFLALATKKMDLGLAYAVWAGCGVAMIAIIGMVYFKEPVTALKLVSLGLVLAGVVGLNIATGGH